MTTKTEKTIYKISTLEKGLNILEILAENGSLSVTELAKLSGQNRSASHRFLAALKDLGYLHQGADSKYSLSLKLFEIANKIDDIDTVRSLARSFMRELSNLYGETVNLGRLDGSDIIVVDAVLGTEVIKFDSHIGDRSPAHTLAMGKAILASRSDEEQQEYLNKCVFKALTSHTITDKQSLQSELVKIKNQGYSIDDEEWALGLRCIAIPIFNAPLPSYAISVSGPTSRMNPEKIEKLRSDLMMAGRAISDQLRQG
ncbi:IclR family transcriptional regulator [Desulforhopalus singaporensis]|nr:IclR family transcriptional regulator [Desulforhopalus singaporensis]